MCLGVAKILLFESFTVHNYRVYLLLRVKQCKLQYLSKSGGGRKAKERKSAVIQAFLFSHVVPASARPLAPDSLTTKELTFVAQSVARNWVELARTLGLQEID